MQAAAASQNLIKGGEVERERRKSGLSYLAFSPFKTVVERTND